MLRILNMQQIGRHYYNPDDPFNIPQHRFGNQSVLCAYVLQLKERLNTVFICLQADNLAWFYDHHPSV